MKYLPGLMVVAATLAAAEPPCVVFSKSFPGSAPAWFTVRVARTGEVEYKEAPDDDQPFRFRLQEQETAEIFGLAEKLEHFRRPLESGLKVANMGEKTLRWEAGEEKREVKFNYSLDPEAGRLLDWFERISETEQHRIHLERSVRFDRLGVNKVLLQLQVSMERNRLVAAEQFLPMLDRVIKNESYLNMARERASALAGSIRAKPKAE